MSTLPLSGVIDINVISSPISTIRGDFNSALIIGQSEVDMPVGTIMKEYNSPNAIIEDIFDEDSEEYKAALLYFSQSPAPTKVYIANKKSTETIAEVISKCRKSNPQWYIVIPTESIIDELVEEDVIEIAEIVESLTPSSILALTFRDSLTYLDLMNALKANAYDRTISMFDNVSINEGKTGIAGIMGYAMGANSANMPAFTLAYKQIIGLKSMDGITGEAFTSLLNANGNAYVNQANYYHLFRQGKVASGKNFDEIIYLDMLVEKIKSNTMTSLIIHPKIPQTNEGINILTNAIENACEEFVDKGFLAPGVWTGANVLSLRTNDALSKGYFVQFAPLETQSQVERENRIAPSCYVCIKTAGAIEHLVISITVNR